VNSRTTSTVQPLVEYQSLIEICKERDVRLAGKSAMVVGAGQTPGETIGNGRATALLFAREGARVLLVDRDEASVRQTQAMIAAEGGTAEVCVGDITSEADCRRMVEACRRAFGRIDILHNNVGIGSGDGELTTLDEAVWERILLPVDGGQGARIG